MPYLIQEKNSQPTAAPASDDPIGAIGEPIDSIGDVERTEVESTIVGEPALLGVFREGQILDDTYRIVRVIGEGGMGVVYEARHARLAGRYAVKALIHKLSDNPEAMFRFDREARITSSLQHPNIVQVIDFNRHTDGTEYLVMEYLQGETLGERLRRVGALPVGMVVGIVEQVAAGLAAAHSHGVVHRDLKPENVFLIPVEGRHVELAKVLDFGISKVSDVHRGFQRPESALMGTPEYMSPEQCQGRPGTVDAASDQFALAAITYQMLTGRTPFSGDSVGAVMSRVLHERPPPMGIDPTLERVVVHGLAKSKVQRFPSVTAFADALRAAAIVSPPARARNPAILYPVPEVTGGDADDQKVPLLRPRRNRAVVPVLIAAASVAVFFVVGSSGVRSMLMPRWPLPDVSSEGDRGTPAEPRPAQMQPVEVDPVEAQPVEARPEVRPIEVRPVAAALDTERSAKAQLPKRPSPKARAIRARVVPPARFNPPRATTPLPMETPRPIYRRPVPTDGDATLPLDETLVAP